jgi:RHS repeat-associated protein
MRNVEGHGFSHAAKPQIRFRKVDGGTTNTYVYNSRGMRAGLAGGENLFDLNGNIVSVVTPGTATLAYNRYTVGGRLLAATISGTTDFYHQDWLGGIRAGSSLSGSLLDSCTNLPFGDGTNNCGLWYFAGLMSDPWDTLNTSATRSQSPTSGRWLTPDPATMAAMDLSNPQTWNRYAYVTNNPVSATDPSGLDEDDDGGGNGDIYTGSSPGFINPDNPTSFQLWSSLAMVGGGSLRNISASEEAAWLGSGSIPWYGVSYTGNSFNGMGGDLMLLVGSSYSWQDNPGWNPEDPNSSAGTGYLSALWADMGPLASSPSNVMYSQVTGPSSLDTISAYHAPIPTVRAVHGPSAADCIIDALNANNGLGLPTGGRPSSTDSIANGVVFQQNTQVGSRAMNPGAPNVAGLSPLAAPGIFVQNSYHNCKGD